jgi:hypothetical protein
MSNPINPHALQDSQVIALAKMLEAVGRPLAPPEAEIAAAIINQRDRLVAAIVARVAARKTQRLPSVIEGLCSQCRANTLSNLAGGYYQTAAQCIAYDLSLHIDRPLTFKAIWDAFGMIVESEVGQPDAVASAAQNLVAALRRDPESVLNIMRSAKVES